MSLVSCINAMRHCDSSERLILTHVTHFRYNASIHLQLNVSLIVITSLFLCGVIFDG